MPRKVRELIRDLKKAGYRLDRQRGSHRIFKHPNISQHIVISGHESDDATTTKKRTSKRQLSVPAKPSDRYRMYVEWSEEDQLFIGYCPDLLIGGVCHDGNRIAAYAKLVDLVEWDIQNRLEKGETLPEPAASPVPS